jgi:ribonuclease G
MKNYELVINSLDGGVELALLEDKNLIELHREKGSAKFTVGDVYLGKVRRVIPELKAAFVDVGYEKDAFLHYSDLGPQFYSYDKYVQEVISGKQNSPGLSYFKFQSELQKDGNIKEVVSSGRNVMVQIAKEPISSKGPRLSTEITLAGRYVVLVPFSNKISVSQKIKEESERDRLRRLMASILPKNFGVIIRTVAENKKVAELDQDLRNLVDRWNELYDALKNAKPPKKLLGEIDKTSAILRDFLNAKFSAIHINDEELYAEVKSYVTSIAPGREKIVKLYKGKLDIFEQFNIHRQIKALFGKQVNLKSGGYLIIEHTEAMHVIDVNSGNRKGAADSNYEQNALAMNLEAAEEIARVLRLRDMGGIIAIDFIDMQQKENNHKLYEFLKEKLSHDRAKHNIAPPSKFGVVELTRQRVRPETDIKTTEKCPTCAGTGEVQAAILILEDIENTLRYLVENKEKSIELLVHPFIESYLKQGFLSIQKKWAFKYKRWVTIRPISKYHFLEYNFVNSDNEIISL